MQRSDELICVRFAPLEIMLAMPSFEMHAHTTGRTVHAHETTEVEGLGGQKKMSETYSQDSTIESCNRVATAFAVCSCVGHSAPSRAAQNVQELTSSTRSNTSTRVPTTYSRSGGAEEITFALRLWQPQPNPHTQTDHW
jgi:hypothetical protein